MTNMVHVIELLPAYSLGCLDETETIQVAEHLATCPECRAELAAYQAVTDRLVLGAREAVPPARLKQNIMAGLQTPQTQPAVQSRQGWWQRLAGSWRGAPAAWIAASLVLALLLAISNLWWWQRADEPTGLQTIALVGTEVAPDAVGTLVVSADGDHGTLVVDGLPVLDESQQYQLWLIRDGQRTSGGVFSVSEEGYGALWVSSPEPLSSYGAFGVTAEPAGGSPGPTGDKVLGNSS